MNSLLSISLEEFIKIRTDEGFEDGRERGLAEGRTEEKLETARRLKAMGLSPAQIAEATGLSPNSEKE